MTKRMQSQMLPFILLVGLLAWVVYFRSRPGTAPVLPGDITVMSVMLDNGQERPLYDQNFPSAFAELSEYTLHPKNKMQRFDRFFSIIGEDIAELKDLTKDSPLPPGAVPKEKWFTAEEGLKEVRTLQERLAANPGMVAHPESAKAALITLEKTLLEAEAKGVRWHLR